MHAAKSLMPPRSGSEAVTLMGRLGYIARGVVYFLVGASAAIAAIWPTYRPAGPSDAVQLGSTQLGGQLDCGQLGHGHPIGAIFLIAVALGLACLAGWFTIAGLMTARRGGGRGWGRGLSLLGDAIVYVFFYDRCRRHRARAVAGRRRPQRPVLDCLAVGLGLRPAADRGHRSGRSGRRRRTPRLGHHRQCRSRGGIAATGEAAD